MEDGPPPTTHVLRPHHVGLLTVFMLVFRDNETNILPPPFLLHIYRVLLSEVSEVAQPKPYRELLHDISTGPKADAEGARKLVVDLESMHRNLRTPDQMTNFFQNTTTLFLEKNEGEEPPILMRRSIFGYFCRRCFVSYMKLSFSGVVKLQKDYQAWCTGSTDAGYEPTVKDQLTNDMLIFKTHADKKTWANSDSYASWERGQATGDENIAAENLRRFFEQHFHESNDSGVRQHALLNLVRMHYVRQEYAGARKLLQEAITVARTSGDRLTLQHCISLLHRLPPEPGQKPALNEIQPHLHPLEVLFDVNKLMNLQNEQPLSASFERIVQAMGLHDQWDGTQAATSVDAEQWGQHAVQSVVWSAAGFEQLAAVEEDIVTAFTEVGGDDNNRISVTVNRAYKRARQGNYEGGLATLLEPDVWRGISVNDYVTWANEVWHILVLRASRRGQDRLYRDFLRSRRPPPIYNPKDYFYNMSFPRTSMVRDELYEVMQMRQCDQATSTIDQLLTALWHSEFQCRLGLYRTGIILLADVGLEFGMTQRCRRVIEEIMPQIINGDDLEQRALGCFVLARCIIAVNKSSASEALLEALPYLLMSEADYAAIQALRSLMDVQYLLSVVYHNLNMEAERDDAARRHFETDEKRKALEAVVVEKEIGDILQLVTEVGAAIAAR